jgi:hypothetical protein
VLLVGFAMIYAQPYFKRLNSPNEMVRVYTTMAIVEHGTYAINAYSPDKYGWINDRSVVGGRYYACKAPGTSFLGVPVYAALSTVAGWFGMEPEMQTIVITLRLACVVLPVFLFLLLFRWYLDRRFGRGWISDVSVLACGLGSILFPSAHIFAGHALAAASAGGAFILADTGIDRLLGGRPWRVRLCGAGLLLGLTPTFEYPAVLVAAAVGIYALVRIGVRPWVWLCLALPALLALLPTLHFHVSAFGGPFTTPYPFVENPYFQTWHNTGWVGLTYPRAERFLGVLFLPSYGLFFLAPVLLPAALFLGVFPLVLLAAVPFEWLAPWTIVPIVLVLGAAQWAMLRLLRPRGWFDARLVLWLVVTLLMILYVSSSEMWRGGWAVGPRFLTVIVPFVVLVVATLLQRFGAERSWRLQSAFAGVLLASCAVQVVCGSLFPHLPEEFWAPLNELILPLLQAGFASSSLGTALGLQGGAFWGPLVVVLVSGVGWLLWRRGVPDMPDRLRRASVAVGAAAVVLGLLLVAPPGSPQTGLEEGFAPWPAVLSAWEPADANPMLAGPPPPSSHDPAAWRAAGRRLAYLRVTPADRLLKKPPLGPAYDEALACYRRARVLELAAAGKVADSQP